MIDVAELRTAPLDPVVADEIDAVRRRRPPLHRG